MLYVTLYNRWAYIEKSVSEEEEMYFLNNTGLVVNWAIYIAHDVISRAFS